MKWISQLTICHRPTGWVYGPSLHGHLLVCVGEWKLNETRLPFSHTTHFVFTDFEHEKILSGHIRLLHDREKLTRWVVAISTSVENQINFIPSYGSQECWEIDKVFFCLMKYMWDSINVIFYIFAKLLSSMCCDSAAVKNFSLRFFCCSAVDWKCSIFIKFSPSLARFFSFVYSQFFFKIDFFFLPPLFSSRLVHVRVQFAAGKYASSDERWVWDSKTSIRSEVDRKYECREKIWIIVNRVESARKSFFFNFIDISTNIWSFSCACQARDAMTENSSSSIVKRMEKIRRFLSSTLVKYHTIWIVIHFDSLRFSKSNLPTTDNMWLPR